MMKHTKKILALLLSLCMLAVFLPMISLAAESKAYAVYNGTAKTLTFCVGELEADGVHRTAGGDPVSGDAYYTDFTETTEILGAAVLPWYENRASVKTVVFLDEIAPKNTAYWFEGFSNLTSFSGLDKLNTGSVTNMGYMFWNCSSLQQLDLSSLNTASVTNMYSMFNDCSSLQHLNLSSFNTAGVTSMGYMFWNCSSLQQLNVSSFNTASVTNMYSMFNGCSSLQHLNLSNFDTRNVTEMGLMFYNCDRLSSLTLGKDFSFVRSALHSTDHLSAIRANDTYTGFWVLEGSDAYRFTSAELIENYDGATKAGTWVWETTGTVTKTDLSDATVDIEDQVYTGNALTPAVTVTLNGTELQKDRDYTVTYQNNTEKGTATVTISGIGNYEGQAFGSFEIVGAPEEEEDHSFSILEWIKSFIKKLIELFKTIC